MGCDAHVKTLLLRYAVDRGKPQQRSCANTHAARATMIRWLGELAARHGGATVHFAYETSCVGFVLYDELDAAGVHRIVVPTTRIPRSAHQRRNKCDVKDAQYLLDLLRGHVLAGSELASAWVPDRETRDAREIVRGRLRTAQRLTATRNEVFGLLKRTGVERPKHVTQSNWTRSYWRWLDSLVDLDGPLGVGGAVRLSSLLSQIRMLEREQAYFDRHIEVLAAPPARRVVTRFCTPSKVEGPRRKRWQVGPLVRRGRMGTGCPRPGARAAGWVSPLPSFATRGVRKACPRAGRAPGSDEARGGLAAASSAARPLVCPFSLLESCP